ncbi:MAG: hypothetical protein ACOYK8_03565 [Alphaproteobacteria bacterium]
MLKILNHSVVFSGFIYVALLTGCVGKRPGKTDIWPSAPATINKTSISTGLSCLGRLIEQTPDKQLDVFVATIGDDTIPVDVAGLLARDTTMMATTAVDRLGTSKITVVGRGAHLPENDLVQLVGGFTELNRTVSSRAYGGAARFGNYEFNLGADETWNTIGLDLALTKGGRLLSGGTVSLSVTVEGENGDSNVLINPSKNKSFSLSSGYKAQEGIHAAQRLLIELGVATLFASHYGIDASICFSDLAKQPDSPIVKPIKTAPQPIAALAVPRQQETSSAPTDNRSVITASPLPVAPLTPSQSTQSAPAATVNNSNPCQNKQFREGPMGFKCWENLKGR